MSAIQYRSFDVDDMAAVCELLNLAGAADGEQMVMEVEELVEDIGPPAVEVAADTLAATVHGEIVGVAWTYYLPSAEREERCYVFGTVHPGHRAKGIGHRLLSWGVEHAGALLKSSGSALPKYVRAEAPDQAADALELFASVGLEPIRYFDTLVRSLRDATPVVDVDGITIIRWPGHRSAEILSMKNTAFASHWGSTPTSPKAWQHKTEGFGARADWSYVAVDADDNIVGVCLSHRYEADDEILGRRVGWIDTLGTLAEWRRRGVAAALINTALRRYQDLGLTHAALNVDSDSPTGANRLYASLGFEPFKRRVTYQTQVQG